MNKFFTANRAVAKPGYTLLEMLISVAIFSGLVIIALGSVATSSSSSARVSGLRERSQAARELVDRITEDFQFIYAPKNASGSYIHPKDAANGNREFVGYYFTADGLVMMLRYPNIGSADPQSGLYNQLVRKQYDIQTVSNRLTLTITETRNCALVSSGPTLDCPPADIIDTDLLSQSFVLEPQPASRIAGLELLDASSQIPKVNGYLQLAITVKPVSYAAQACATTAGICYSLSTTLNAGAAQ